MVEYFNIAIVGSGNLAWHLAPELENAGHRITDVYSPTKKNAKALQKRLYNAELNLSLDFSKSIADIIIISVSDDAIEEVAREIAMPEDAIIVHTSGSQPLSRLGYVAAEFKGVFYPLQTFTKSKGIAFDDVSILIEAEDPHSEQVLKKLAKTISKNVHVVSSKDRLAVHVAAVFACNFTNHLFNVSDKILQQHGFDFELLRPLIAETINKSLDIGPKNAQTGPAVRGDLETLNLHMEYLNGDEYQKLYKLITDLILKR